jgi:hypothetical protein
MDPTVTEELITALETWLTEHPVLWRGANGETRAIVDERGRPLALIAAEVHRELRDLRAGQRLHLEIK